MDEISLETLRDFRLSKSPIANRQSPIAIPIASRSSPKIWLGKIHTVQTYQPRSKVKHLKPCGHFCWTSSLERLERLTVLNYFLTKLKMGLDQYAYRKREYSDSLAEAPKFYWRKHAKFQEWMEGCFVERTQLDSYQLNSREFELFPADIQRLEKAIIGGTLPECPGGFFYGHELQEATAKQYRRQDLAFCVWARGVFARGERVFFSCSW